MAKVETTALRSAASGIRADVVPKLAALQGMTDETEVSFPSFGIALSFVNSQYQEFRTYMVESIKAAHDQMQRTADQLDLAAKHWEDVEAAIAQGLKTP